MIFKTHELDEKLNPYIVSIFYFKDFIPDHSIERVVPTGHSFLIFELDGFSRNTFNNKSLKPNGSYEKAWISGVHKNYLSISAHKESEMLVVQFKAFGTYPFFYKTASDFSEKVQTASEILGAEIFNVRSEILKKENAEDKFKVIESYLLARYEDSKKPPKEIVELVNELMKKPYEESSNFLENYSNTQKHLIDQFKKYIGVTPKSLHRIIRFNEILQRTYKNEKIEWSEIAYQCGFSDQSHFIKEFKYFSGFNPKEFIKNDYHLDQPNFFPLDKEG
jgi:AraC-like DNA-binding protein